MSNARLLVLALVALAVVGCGRGDLREYVSEKGQFKVLLYPNPMVEGRRVGNSFGDGAISVDYRDGEVPGSEREAQKRLERERASVLANLSASSIGDSKLSLAGKYPGRLITAELTEGRGDYRARLYLVGGRLYIVQAIGAPSFIQSDEVDRFLESFEVIP